MKNLLQCMILFAVIFGGQVMSSSDAKPTNIEYMSSSYGGSSYIYIITHQNYKPKQSPSDVQYCIYSDTSGYIFLKHDARYKVINFRVALGSKLDLQSINGQTLLPIYYGNRLGLILEKVQDQPKKVTDQPGIVNSQTTSPKPATQQNSKKQSTKPPAPAKQYLLAFQRTTPNAEGLYEFDYLPLSKEDLDQLIKYSQNPKDEKFNIGKYIFIPQQFSFVNGRAYYLDLQLGKETKFQTTPPTPPN